MTCPLFVAKQVVGAHFSRDYDDDPSADMVTIDSLQFSGNGMAQFYVSIRLLDYARHDLAGATLAQRQQLFREYFPYAAGVDTVDTLTITNYVSEAAGVNRLIQRHINDVEAQLESFEDRLRVSTLKSRNATIVERVAAPTTVNPLSIHEWLRETAKWLRRYKAAVPNISKRPPVVPKNEHIDIGALNTVDDYKRATQRLLDEESTVCRYLGKVEQYYTWASGFLNDISDAIQSDI